MKMLIELIFPLSGMAVAFFAAGCGGSGNAGEATTPEHHVVVHTGSLSKAQFINRADAICAEGRRRVVAELGAFISHNPDLSTPRFPNVYEHAPELVNTIIVPAYQREIDRIQSLGAPPGR